MALLTHGDVKYPGSQLLAGSTHSDALRVEHRQVAAGAHNPLTSQCTELVVILSGQAIVRRTGDGQKQEGLALPGTSWLVPAGTHETQLELDDPLACLHLYLPATLLEHSALADFGIDPDKMHLAYVGGIADPVLAHIGRALQEFLRRGVQTTDRLFVDGIRAALAAHLIGGYTVERWRLPERSPALNAKRLKRVLDFIEARLASDISLDDLAAEACFSSFHFSRLFRAATGLSPHRYVTERRIEAARRMLASNKVSLVQVAVDTGLGSQANFTRVFRKTTGLTPGQYREQSHR
ncbi:AraC family transcriptional regulator [Povalibacter sp.]|uniref:AraC family transcriptional regulator n=1 Tax=Povalibacter sp. TaxID=1962978 RepID=UPI002F40146C